MRALASTALAAALLVACQGAGDKFGDAFGTTVQAQVTVAADDGTTTTVDVLSSMNDDCKEGVSQLRNSDWEVAAEYLERAVDADPEDERATFALGIAYEMMGEYEAALDTYKAANLLPKAENASYKAAVQRVQAKSDG